MLRSSEAGHPGGKDRVGHPELMAEQSVHYFNPPDRQLGVLYTKGDESVHKNLNNRAVLDPGVWHSSATLNIAFAVIAMTIVFATPARAQSRWYLMAPEENIVSNPRVAIRMEHGPVLGPLEFTSRRKFLSRAECEPARQKLVAQWRQLSVIKRGSWKYGFTSPSAFVRCVSADDPQLKKSRADADAGPSMETFLNRPTRW